MEIVIVGAGKLDYKLAETLGNDDNDIRIVDVNEKVLQKVVNRLPREHGRCVPTIVGLG